MALQEEFESQGNFLFRYRSFLPLFIILAGIAVFIFNHFDENKNTMLNYDMVESFSLLMSFTGLGIRVYTVGHAPANTSGRNTKEGQIAEELNTTGIYSVVRHPLYLGNFFMWLGPAILTEDFWFVISFILFYGLYYERIMYAEEQFLRKKFGSVYTEWAARVPAIVPALTGFIEPKYQFSIKKVLRKEKNGLLAIFVLLFVFHNLCYSFQQQQITIAFDWVLWTMIAAAIIYFVLRFMRRKTNLLNEDGR
ncbi:MAG: isoprenylcysteine carboxylmethyltransferase family protein [Paludibacter sp.]|nr:isoprenylcysteine carboxylmethyltransferase family protein [Paludibacter sp.]